MDGKVINPRQELYMKIFNSIEGAFRNLKNLPLTSEAGECEMSLTRNDQSMHSLQNGVKNFLRFADGDTEGEDNGSSKAAPLGDFEVTIKLVNPKGSFTGIQLLPTVEDLSKVLVKFGERKRYEMAKAEKDVRHFVLEIDRTLLAAGSPFSSAELAYMVRDSIFTWKQALDIIFTAYFENISYLTLMKKDLVNRLVSVFYPVAVYTSIYRNTMVNYFYDYPTINYDKEFIDVAALGAKIRQTYSNPFPIPAETDPRISYCTRCTGVENSDVQWANNQIKYIKHNRGRLQAELLIRASRTPSPTMKNALLNICTNCGIGMSDRYTGQSIAMESVVDSVFEGEVKTPDLMQKADFVKVRPVCYRLEEASEQVFGDEEAALEGFLRQKNPRLPSNYAIDDISIEIDKIKTDRDRSYVLDLIYSRIDELDAFEDACKHDKTLFKHNADIKQCRENLEKLRTAVLNKKIAPKRYGIFIEYPKGYEG